MPRQPIPTNRMDRASRFLMESAPDLEFANMLDSAASQGMRDDLAVASFNANQQQQFLANDRIMRQQELENARAAARDAIEAKAQADEVAFLKFASTAKTNKPNADVELAATLAMFPSAFRSPAVREVFARKTQEAEINKQFANTYATATGGEPLPVTDTGDYDMPRAQLRMFRSQQLNDAISKGLVSPEDAAGWKQVDEYTFLPSWKGHIAQLEGEATLRKANRDQNDKRIEQLGEISSAISATEKMLRPTDVELLDPANPRTAAYKEAMKGWTPTLTKATDEIIARAQSTGPKEPAPANAPKAGPATLDAPKKP